MYKAVFKRALKDTLSELGSSWGRIIRNIIFWVIALLVVRVLGGWEQMSEEIRWFFASGIALGIVLLGLFLFNLFRAPVYIRFEGKMKPRLEIVGFNEQKDGAFGDGCGWGLMIKNVGIEEAENCSGKLEQIEFESSAMSLKRWAIARPLHWSGQAAGLHDFRILGGQTARLGIIYLDYKYGPMSNVITLAYRTSEELRLRYELSAFNKPVLLLLSIASKGTLPQYVVCRVDLEMLVRDLLIEDEDRLVCQILWKGTESRDLTDFRKPNQETSS